MKFNAYIDGFSLYKGSLSRHPELKWLDLPGFCQSRRADMQLGEIYYFTANVKERYPGDDAPRRQQAYLRVLMDQGVRVVHGKFRKDTDWLRLGASNHREFLKPNLPRHLGLTQFAFDRVFKATIPDIPQARVWKYGEKGSDVNLASHLLRDVFKNNLAAALVVSADADFVTPIRMAVENGVNLKLLHTVKGRDANELKAVATHFEEIHKSWLSEHQLPRGFRTRNGGNIQRPSAWT